jgi:hypothetical protein
MRLLSPPRPDTPRPPRPTLGVSEAVDAFERGALQSRGVRPASIGGGAFWGGAGLGAHRIFGAFFNSFGCNVSKVRVPCPRTVPAGAEAPPCNPLLQPTGRP